MTMHAVFLKEREGTLSLPRWSGLGSAAPAVTYRDATVQSSIAFGGFSAVGNQYNFAQHHQQGVPGAGNTCSSFTLFPGYALSDGKRVENGVKTQLLTACPVQPITMGYERHFELGSGQPLIYAKYPHEERCDGLYATYGTQVAGRIMLPLSMTRDEVPIFVNPKQYNRIMRRRKKRAELESKNKMLKLRKPYLHLSRHLHALRRPRGIGGRFLTKNSSEKISSTKWINKDAEKQLPDPTDQSFRSEVVQFEVGIGNSSKGTSIVGGRSTSSGSEVSSDPFESLNSAFQLSHPNYNGWDLA